MFHSHEKAGRRTQVIRKLVPYYLIKHELFSVSKDLKTEKRLQYGFFVSEEKLEYGDRVCVDDREEFYGYVVGCMVCSEKTFRKMNPGYMIFRKCKKYKEKVND